MSTKTWFDGGVPEDAEDVGLVAVAVEVAVRGCRTALYSPPNVAVVLAEDAEAVRAVGRRRIGDAAAGERAAGRGDLGRHVEPRRVVVGERIGAGDPVDDLALAGARREQARVVERLAGVDDADRDAAAVPRRVGVDELRGAGVLGRHVRVGPRRRGARRRSAERAARSRPDPDRTSGIGTTLSSSKPLTPASADAASALPAGTLARR